MALDFVAGCFGGIAGVVVGHPLDTVKVHLQVQDPKCPRYKGTLHCLTTIVKKESVRGLFKGMTSPLAGVAFINAITFGTYGNILRRLPADWNPTVGVLVAGSAAGLVQSIVASPIELAKSRLQVAGDFQTSVGSRQRRLGPLNCLAAVRSAHGWRRGVFRGLAVTAMRDAPGFGLYFATYELVCGLLTACDTDNDDQLACAGSAVGVAGPFAVIVAGGIGGTTSWVFTYPMDVVKTRVQTDVKRRYTSAIHCFVECYRREGVTSFSRGMSSTILRAFPTNAATFLAVSITFKLLGNRFQEPEVACRSSSSAGGGGGSTTVSVTPANDTSIKWPPLVLQQSMDENAAICERGWQAAHANL